MLSRVVADWPEAISPQILRSRLFAFKQKLSDAEYGLGACAVCAREKRRCKLAQVEFPPPTGAASSPPWLGWSNGEWKEQAALWYERVNDLLSVGGLPGGHLCH